MKKKSHKGIKKLVSFALALAVTASLLPAAALPAEASEQAAPVETSAAPTEVSGYLDNETPEQLDKYLFWKLRKGLQRPGDFSGISAERQRALCFAGADFHDCQQQ